MSELTTLSAAEITTDRLVLRKARDSDREGIIELQTDAEVRAYLGGPRPRGDVEQYLDVIGTANAAADPGTFVIAENKRNSLVGILTLKRRSVDQPGHVTEEGEELELGYLLRRSAWGQGFAFEAAMAALCIAADELPDQPVLIVTQSANGRSLKLAARLGFQPVGTFEEFGAEQTLATTLLHSYKA